MQVSNRQIKRQPLIVAKQMAKMKPNPHFTIVQDDPDSYEKFYILLHPQGGHYANQKHVLELKTVYGHGTKYYFPFNPPSIRFVTEIYHTNISKKGIICLDILKEVDKWSPQYTIEKVMISIIALLDDPNTSSPYNLEASRHWTRCCRNYKNYISTSNLSGKGQLEAKKKIFADYEKYADIYAAKKNNLSNWVERFPQLLDLGKISLKDSEKDSKEDEMEKK